MVELLADAPAYIGHKIAVDRTRLAVDPADRGLLGPKNKEMRGRRGRVHHLQPVWPEPRFGKTVPPVLTRAESDKANAPLRGT
jgi:hypothetical protein